MTKLFNNKALSAFRKLGAVALITATLAICFTACKQTGGGGNTDGGGGKPTPTPKHEVTFSVDGANGTLNAKAEGMATETEKSPITVEEGKTVTLTATANAGYNVKEWKVDGKPVADVGKSNTYIHTVKKSVTIIVSFEAIPPTKYTVTLNQAEGGTVTASPEIPEDKQVAKDTEITFTATANAGYKIGKWTVTGSVLEEGTGADGSETAKVKITSDTTVTVSFELLPPGKVILTLMAGKNTVRLCANTADGSAITVEGCTETTLAPSNGLLTKLTVKEAGGVVTLTGYITEFHCSGIFDRESITVLNVSGLTSLEKLICEKAQLTSLNVQGCTALKELDCSDNQLTELNVQDLTTLQKLDCEKNQLTKLNVQGLTTLQRLDCGKNQLTELNVRGCTFLQTMDCYNNNLSTLDVHGLTALQWFDCSKNQLTALNVQGLTALKELRFSDNKLNAETMTKLLTDLPQREADDNAVAFLYTERAGEGNWKNFTKPKGLKAAFDDAKGRNWKLRKWSADGEWGDI